MKNKTTLPKPIIKNDKEKPIPVEIIAQAIIDVAAAAKKLKESKLSMRAIQILIQDAAPRKLSLTDIEVILNTAAILDKKYIKS